MKYILAIVHFNVMLFFLLPMCKRTNSVRYLLPPTHDSLLCLRLFAQLICIKIVACASCEQACTALITAMAQQKPCRFTNGCLTLLALHISSTVVSDMMYPICATFYFRCSLALHIHFSFFTLE
uniref:Putative secreted protein n=1 Tax=Amblyomma tuberculatum TaxID=48802 RepID=A0A6M2E2H6_9ACAR